MTEKVKLPKEVCDAFDFIRNKHSNASEILQAIVAGYEPEMTAEEKLKNVYMEYEVETEYCNGVQNGMTEKVKLPKEVCDALDKAKKEFLGYSFHQIVNRLIDENSAYKSIKFFNYYNTDTIYRALVLGYEPELSVEEQIKELYKCPPTKNYEDSHRRAHEKSYCGGMLDTLKILGIHYDWMDGVE
jgi:hypothetical protein